jgi:hypothetical protein
LGWEQNELYNFPLSYYYSKAKQRIFTKLRY